MSSKQLVTLLMSILLSVVIIQVNATDYPQPPTVPPKFESADDVQRYLNLLHNYYLVVGRPRFGKRSSYGQADLFVGQKLNKNLENKKIEKSHLFSMMDINGKDF
jgi:hypothetical protein